MHAPCLLFAYFGPETVLPMTSFIATIVGCGMMFGRFFVRHIIRFCRMVWLLPRRGVMPTVRSYRGPHTARGRLADQAMSAGDDFEEQQRRHMVTESQ
jgi:hypothetical protein